MSNFFCFFLRILFLCLWNSMGLSMRWWCINGFIGYVSKRRSSVRFGGIKFCFLMFCFCCCWIKLFLLMWIRLFVLICMILFNLILRVNFMVLCLCVIFVLRWRGFVFGRWGIGLIIWGDCCIIFWFFMLWILRSLGRLLWGIGWGSSIIFWVLILICWWIWIRICLIICSFRFWFLVCCRSGFGVRFGVVMRCWVMWGWLICVIICRWRSWSWRGLGGRCLSG